MTYVGIKPFARSNEGPTKHPAKAARYDRKAKAYLEVDCPQMIREYNSHMDGVDLINGLMGRYNIRAKSHDAITRLFYHFIDMAVTNAYILHKRMHAEKVNDSSNVSAKEWVLQLPRFRETVAASLVTYQEKRPVGRSNPSTSRPSTSVDPQPGSSSVRQKSKHPLSEVGYDG
ncbi:uncharacterized protein [Diabrotica undecimpunctata]|uniref:uncharacterized protein n=1 Tax=Diabrotica undecimpunctata TaxID=50387 RepID=UPI003B63243C